MLSTNRNFGVIEHWSLNVRGLVRSWTLASRHVTELTEVLKQVNKYSNRVFQSKLSEQYWVLPSCLPLDVNELTVKVWLSRPGTRPPLVKKKKKKKPAARRTGEGESAVSGATDRNCHPVGTEYFSNTSPARVSASSSSETSSLDQDWKKI